MSALLAIDQEHVAAQFQQIKVNVTTTEAEAIAVDSLIKSDGLVNRLAEPQELDSNVVGT